MKNIIENIKLTVQMIIIGAILLYSATLILMPKQTVKIFGFQPFVVLTESMEPKIAVNDVVVVTKFNSEDAKIGDIITFNADIDYNGTLETITHYIYSIDDSGEEILYRTNRHFEDVESVTPDTWMIPASQVIGSYGFHIKYLGLIIGFIKSIYGIVVISLNLVIFSVVKYMSKQSKKDKLINENELTITTVKQL